MITHARNGVVWFIRVPVDSLGAFVEFIRVRVGSLWRASRYSGSRRFTQAGLDVDALLGRN